VLAPPATHTPSKLRRRSSDDGDTLRLLQNRDRLLAVLQGVLGSDAALAPLASDAVTRSLVARGSIDECVTRLDGSAPPAVRAAAARAVELLAKVSVKSRDALLAHIAGDAAALPAHLAALSPADGADDGAALAAFLGAMRALVELGASDAQTRAYLGEKRQEASDAVDALREVEGSQLAELHEASRLRPGAADDADAAAKVLKLEQSVAATQAELVDAVAAARACAGLPQLVISLVGGAAALLALCSPRRKLGSSVSVLTPMKSQRPGGGMPERRNSGDFLAEPAADLQSTAAAGRALLCAVCAESSSLALVLDALTAALLAAREGAARAAAAATAVVALNALSDAKVLLRHMTRGRTGPWLAPALTVLGAAVRAAENDPLTALAAADVPPPLHLDPRLVVAMARELGSRKIDQLETRGDHEEAEALRAKAAAREKATKKAARRAWRLLGLVLHATVRMRLLAQRRAVELAAQLADDAPRGIHGRRPATIDAALRAVRDGLGAEVMRVAPSLEEAEPPSGAGDAARVVPLLLQRAQLAHEAGAYQSSWVHYEAAQRVLVHAGRPAPTTELELIASRGSALSAAADARLAGGDAIGAALQYVNLHEKFALDQLSWRQAEAERYARAEAERRPRYLKALGHAAGAAAMPVEPAPPADDEAAQSVLGLLGTVAVAPPGLGGFGGSGTGFKLDFAKLVKEQQAQQARARSQSGGGTAKGKGAGRWGDMTSRREKEKAAAAALGAATARAAPPGPDDALLQAAHAANKRGDFVAARRHFRAAFDLSRKPEAAISAANMAAKNGEVQAALDEYDELLRGGGAGALSSVHRSFVIRKRAQVETDAGIAQE